MGFIKNIFFVFITFILLQSCSGGRIGNFLDSCFINTEESKFSYGAIKKFLSSNTIEYSDEGGWFKISIEEDDSFLLVNGLNPGKFVPEDGLLETQVMTLIYSFKPKANSVSAFSKMIDIAQLMADNFQSEILDSDRNNLTKQMVDHYSQIAEEFDLNNLA